MMNAVPHAPTVTGTRGVERANTAIGLTIDRRTNESEWEGRGADLNTIITGLDSILDRARTAFDRTTDDRPVAAVS